MVSVMDKIERTSPAHNIKRARHPFWSAMWITILCIALVAMGYFMALAVDSFMRTM